MSKSKTTASKETILPMNDSKTIITLKRTMCLGFCPVYSLAISADGGVTCVGEHNVTKVGRREYRIAKSKVQQLVRV